LVKAIPGYGQGVAIPAVSRLRYCGSSGGRRTVLQPAALGESTVGAWGANGGPLKGLWGAAISDPYDSLTDLNFCRRQSRTARWRWRGVVLGGVPRRQSLRRVTRPRGRPDGVPGRGPSAARRLLRSRRRDRAPRSARRSWHDSGGRPLRGGPAPRGGIRPRVAAISRNDLRKSRPRTSGAHMRTVPVSRQ
jgi:hypothetical protein